MLVTNVEENIEADTEENTEENIKRSQNRWLCTEFASTMQV